MHKRKKGFPGLSALGLMTICLAGCVLAIPSAIRYFATHEGYIATAEVSHPANEVYDAIVREAGGAGPNVKIIKKDDAGRLLEVSDGMQTATVKVLNEGEGETQVIISTTAGDRNKENNLAVQMLLHLCEGIGEQCSVRE